MSLPKNAFLNFRRRENFHFRWVARWLARCSRFVKRFTRPRETSKCDNASVSAFSIFFRKKVFLQFDGSFTLALWGRTYCPRPWWWSSGYRACLLLRRTEFKLRRNLLFFMKKLCLKRSKINKKGGQFKKQIVIICFQTRK